MKLSQPLSEEIQLSLQVAINHEHRKAGEKSTAYKLFPGWEKFEKRICDMRAAPSYSCTLHFGSGTYRDAPKSFGMGVKGMTGHAGLSELEAWLKFPEKIPEVVWEALRKHHHDPKRSAQCGDFDRLLFVFGDPERVLADSEHMPVLKIFPAAGWMEVLPLSIHSPFSSDVALVRLS